MPRINLTEAEAEQIRLQRELAAQHAITYNQALDDLYFALREDGRVDCEGVVKEIMLRLRRE